MYIFSFSKLSYFPGHLRDNFGIIWKLYQHKCNLKIAIEIETKKRVINLNYVNFCEILKKILKKKHKR